MFLQNIGEVFYSACKSYKHIPSDKHPTHEFVNQICYLWLSLMFAFKKISFQLLPYLSVLVCLRWLYHHIVSISFIYTPWNLVLLPFLLCSLWCVQITGSLWPEGRICLFAHYGIPSSSLYRLKATLNMKYACCVYFLSIMLLRLYQFSTFSLCNIWACVFPADPFLSW